MPYCTNCGHDNPEGANFCGQCGSPLPSLGGAPSPGPASGERGSESGGGTAGSGSSAVGPDLTPIGDTTRNIFATPEERDFDGLTTEDEAAVDALPQGSALLIVQRGANAGSRFLLDTDVATAGRHQDSDIFLDDISVSRRHAEFTRTAGGVVVRDAGSLNGTYVNRDLVDQHLLQPGDEVQIGKFRLVYFASPQDTE